MTARFVHTADLHVGKSRTLPDYLERQTDMIDGIYKVARDRGIKTVLMAGDIFESKNIRWSEQQMFVAKLFEMDYEGFTTVVCNGNHDELETGVSHMWLPEIIAKYGGLKHTHVIDSNPRVVELDDMEIAVIPVVNNNISTKELATRVEEMYGQVSGSKPFVVMLHATISGSNTDLGTSISGGPRIPDTIEFVDYWAAGDIHRSQEIGNKAWYSGAPMQHNFGDHQPKGVLVVEIEQGEDPSTELVELEGIKPLITLTEKPDVWPTDCYIRYLGPLEGIIELPDNVIKTGNLSVEEQEGEDEQDSEEVKFTDSLTEGLTDFLNTKGISVELQEEGIRWVQEKYLK